MNLGERTRHIPLESEAFQALCPIQRMPRSARELLERGGLPRKVVMARRRADRHAFIKELSRGGYSEEQLRQASIIAQHLQAHHGFRLLDLRIFGGRITNPDPNPFMECLQDLTIPVLPSPLEPLPLPQ